MLAFKSRTKESSKGLFLKVVNDVLSQKKKQLEMVVLSSDLFLRS